MKVESVRFVRYENNSWYEYRLTTDFDGNGERVGGHTYRNTPPTAEMVIRVTEPIFNVGEDVPIVSPKPEAPTNYTKWFGDAGKTARTIMSKIREFRNALKDADCEWNEWDVEQFLKKEVD